MEETSPGSHAEEDAYGPECMAAVRATEVRFELVMCVVLWRCQESFTFFYFLLVATLAKAGPVATHVYMYDVIVFFSR